MMHKSASDYTGRALFQTTSSKEEVEDFVSAADLGSGVVTHLVCCVLLPKAPLLGGSRWWDLESEERK